MAFHLSRPCSFKVNDMLLKLNRNIMKFRCFRKPEKCGLTAHIRNILWAPTQDMKVFVDSHVKLPYHDVR